MSLKGKNKRFSDCGSIKGFAANKCSIAGNHGCVGHTGKMKIPIAESDLIFVKSLFSRQNGGNPYEKNGLQLKEKASVIKASGSGNQETKFNVCLFSLDANRSRSGSPKRLHISKKTSLFKHHSISSLKLREKKSAMSLSGPGIWEAVNQKLCLTHHTQIHLPRKLSLREWVPPMWLIYATAQELLLQMRTCNPCSILKNDFRA